MHHPECVSIKNLSNDIHNSTFSVELADSKKQIEKQSSRNILRVKSGSLNNQGMNAKIFLKIVEKNFFPCGVSFTKLKTKNCESIYLYFTASLTIYSPENIIYV